MKHFIRRWLADLVILCFLVGGYLAITMAMDHQMSMGCVISANTASPTCMMDPGQHLAWWSSTFTGIPGSASLLELIFLIGTALLIGFVENSFNLFGSLAAQLARRGKAPPDEQLRDYVTRYLITGRAQPLLYA